MALQREMKDLSISIAIPVYNQVATIASTIESALKATEGLSGTEIVVSENHSNDGTCALVDQYKGLVKVVRPPVHLDISSNFNFVVGSCAGEWVGMLSGDDRIYPAYIPAIRKAIHQYPLAVFAMGGWRNFDAQSGSKTRRRVLSLKTVTKPAAATKSLLMGPKASFSSFCFRKSAFERVGGFPCNYNLLQDWVLQFNLSLIGGFTKTNAVISEYTCGQDRGEIEMRRVPYRCEDLATFCLSTIWTAKKAGIEHSLLIDACEEHMARAELLLSRHPEFRSKCNQYLRPVYELIGKERILLRHGAVRNDFASDFKQLIRQVAESIIPG